MYLIFGILFFLAQAAQAADPCLKCKLEQLVDFSGGLNTTFSAHQIPKNFSPNMKNVFIDEGRIRKVAGITVVGSTNVLQSGAFSFTFNKEDGSKEFIVSDSSVMLSTKDYVFYTFIASGITQTVNLDCAQVRNKVWCTNGVDPVFTWDSLSRVKLDGTLGNPNVPRGKYIEFFQERVFVGNTASNGSALNWSDVKSTNNVAIAPDSFLAWPQTNGLNISQGDGEVITGLWIEKGQLKIGKERSIHTLFGTNTLSYFSQKTNPDIGVASNDSVVLLDGAAHYLGADGIYRGSQRVSDAIQPNVDMISRETARVLENTWETLGDFSRGSAIYGATATAGGFVTVFTDTHVLINFLQPSATNAAFHFDAANLATLEVNLASAVPPPHGYFGFIGGLDEIRYDGGSNQKLMFRNTAGGGPCAGKLGTVTFKNFRTNQTVSASQNLTGGAGYTDIGFDFSLSASKLFVSGQDFKNSSFTIKVEADASAGCEWDMALATTAAKIVLTPSSTAQFISDITTLPAVTAWGNFLSVNNANTGAITYSFRTSSSAVNIATRTWANITPGVRIDAPTNELVVQWGSTISSVLRSNPSNIDSVSIGHIEGSGSKNRAFAAAWKNRYWLSVATETSGKFSVLYVKSRITNSNPDAWMPIEGINIRSMCKDGSDVFYAGAASTGVFYRMDYGTSFDGKVIEAIYETPDLYMDDPFYEKSFLEYFLIADKESGANLKLGVSVDGGAFSDRTISLDGSGRLVKSISNVRNVSGKYIRFRFKNDQLDKALSFLNFGAYYEPTLVRKGTND